MTPDVAAANRRIRRGLVITAIGLVGLAALYVLALEYTPAERFQGLAQKIYYVHPPGAYAMQLAFTVVGIVSALYLWLRDERLDHVAEASAEVGLVFAVLTLVTGPIWGKPVWGAWWTWDSRLTFTLIEFLLFAGYFALRSAMHDRFDRARYSAVVGTMALLLVPFNHLTVYLYNTTHPKPIVMQTSKPALPDEMLGTFLVGLAVFTVLYVGFVMTRYGIGVRRAMQEAAHA